jgi:hypothetical protein
MLWFSKPEYVAPVVPPSRVRSDDGYTIGWTDDERIMLKVTSGFTTLSVIMTDLGVRRMIKQLEATLPEEENDQPAT